MMNQNTTRLARSAKEVRSVKLGSARWDHAAGSRRSMFSTSRRISIRSMWAKMYPSTSTPRAPSSRGKNTRKSTISWV